MESPNLTEGQQLMLDDLRRDCEHVDLVEDEALTSKLPDPGGLLVFAGPARRPGYSSFDSEYAMLTPRGEAVHVVVEAGQVQVDIEAYMDPEAPLDSERGNDGSS